MILASSNWRVAPNCEASSPAANGAIPVAPRTVAAAPKSRPGALSLIRGGS